MKKESYISVINYLNERKKLKNSLIIFEKAAELFIYAVYPLFLIWLLIEKNGFWLRSAITCAVGFILVTIIRELLNVQRPYTKYGFTPLIKKEATGNSMPSRHCFSAAVIAVNITAVCLPLGIFIGLLAVVLASLRVLLGVHFIRDVAVGLVIGLIVGLTVFI